MADNDAQSKPNDRSVTLVKNLESNTLVLPDYRFSCLPTLKLSLNILRPKESFHPPVLLS